MIHTSKILRFGKTLAVTLPKELVNSIPLKKGDTVQLKLIYIGKLDDSVKHYKCVACSHCFDIDDDTPECPACGNENVIMEDTNEN